METTYADSWSEMAQPCDMDLWVMKWRSAWPVFHSPVIFVLYLEDYVMYVHHTLGVLWKYESVWPDVWPQSKCRSLWPIFHGPVIWPYILKVIWCMNIFIWDYESLWPDVWAQINVGHCDLYFMVHWFGLISWRLFDVWNLYLGLWIIMMQRLTSK